MKKIWIWLFLIVGINQGYSQKPFISADGFSVVYIGLDNPIVFTIPDVPFEKTFIVCDQGEIVRNDSQFLWRSTDGKPGILNIKLGKLTKRGDSQFVHSEAFRIKKVPVPRIQIGAVYSGVNARLSSLRVQTVIFAIIDNFAFEGARSTVTEYTAHFFSRNFGYQKLRIQSNSAIPLQSYYSRMHPGDLLILDSVHCEGPGGLEYVINHVHFSEGNNQPWISFVLDGKRESFLPQGFLLNTNRRYDSLIFYFSGSAAGDWFEHIYSGRNYSCRKKIKNETFNYSLQFIGDSTFVIQNNGITAKGKLKETNIRYFEWEKNPYFESDTSRFLTPIYLPIVQKYKPYGNWTFEEKNKLIAEGEVGLRPILNQSGDGTWNTYILQGRPFKFYK